MIRQLLRRGQITLPTALLKKFGLKEKDYVQITEVEAGVLVQPVSISDYSPSEMEGLRKKLDELPRGKKKLFQSFEESKKHLDSLKDK